MEPYVPPWIGSTTIVTSLLTAVLVGIGFVRRARSVPSPRPAMPAWPLIGSVVLALWLLAAFILGSQGFFHPAQSLPDHHPGFHPACSRRRLAAAFP